MNKPIGHYTRNQFVSLLKELYNASADEDGYNIKFPNHSSKEISSQLGFSEQQFSRQSQPSFKGSYENIIKRLEKEKVTRTLEKNNSSLQRWISILSIVSTILLLGFLYLFFIVKRIK